MEVQFIEPCCVEKQLPQLLREQSFVPFQTNGDVTFEHFLKAISCLAGNEISISLVIPSLDIDMLRNLAWLARRGWLKQLQVCTATDQSQTIHNELASIVPELHCYHHGNVCESLLVIEGELASVALQGYLTSKVTPGLHFYYATTVPNATTIFARITTTVQPLFRNEDVPTPATTSAEEGGVETATLTADIQEGGSEDAPTDGKDGNTEENPKKSKKSK